jgi:hypothetical protein
VRLCALEVLIGRGLKPPHQHGPNCSHQGRWGIDSCHEADLPNDIAASLGPVVEDCIQCQCESYRVQCLRKLTSEASLISEVGEAHFGDLSRVD